MTPVEPKDLRARRRPLAVLFVYAAELVGSLIIAAPAHAWAGRAWGGHPEGDSVLFRAGGRELLLWLGQADAALGVVSRTSVVLLAVGAVLMQLPLGALLASLAFTRGGEPAATPRSLRPLEALRAAVSTLLPLAGALALGTLAVCAVVALGAMAASAVDHAATQRLGDARAFQLGAVTFALFAALAAVVGVVLDLARAAIVRDAGLTPAAALCPPGGTLLVRGARTALRASRRALLRAVGAWAWRAALGLALLGAGAAAAQALGGRGGWALAGLWLIHQGVVLGRVALRASWLARALGLVAPLSAS